MVVRIKSPHSLTRAVNYNEKKVQQGKALCIHAGNYLKTPMQMNIHEKMERMQDLIARNERSQKSNMLHISLNFDPTEKLANDKLTAIASSYMDKIGFGNQPFLVYVHSDAGHPHIHIVTTNIQADGKRIDTYNLGKNQSEKARKEIEIDFALVAAHSKGKSMADTIKPVDVQRVQYGNAETKRSITNVLDAVLPKFKYTSLAELNAVLQQYNVKADAGSIGGIIQRNGGLLYRLLDKDGKSTGVPVKASSIYNKPTLKFLEERFSENDKHRDQYKKKIKNSIDWVLSKSPPNLQALAEGLKKDNVQTVLRQNKDGLIYGITFIDFRTKVVFNGSDLGKAYSVKAIEDKISANSLTTNSKAFKRGDGIQQQPENSKQIADAIQKTSDESKDSILGELMDAEKNLNRVSADLLRKKRKKRNKNI